MPFHKIIHFLFTFSLLSFYIFIYKNDVVGKGWEGDQRLHHDKTKEVQNRSPPRYTSQITCMVAFDFFKFMNIPWYALHQKKI